MTARPARSQTRTITTTVHRTPITRSKAGHGPSRFMAVSPLQRDFCGQDLVRAVARHDLKVAVFKDEGFVVPEGEHPGGDGKGNRLLLTGSKVDLDKVLKLLDRTDGRGRDVVDIELDGLPAGD